MECIEILKREHGMVRRVVETARRHLEGADAAADLDAGEAATLVDFLHYFSESCHDPKEERLLYRLLRKRGLTWDGYPLRELIREHEEMNIVLAASDDWLPRAAEGEAAAAPALVNNLEMYIDLVERHMDNEEDVVFPLALQWFTGDDFESLSTEFAAMACDELADGVHAHYCDLAHLLAGDASVV